jgi:hypothetical protein
MIKTAMSFDEIKELIQKDYSLIKKQPYLEPYLDPILSLKSVNDNYHMDSGISICLYFLSNAGSWKTDNAKIVKKELKKLC